MIPRLLVACVALIGLRSVAVAADIEHAFRLKCRDGFELEATYRHPTGVADATTPRVIILLHGSGPQSMDEDLTAATKKQKKNLLFRELAESLAAAGFTVVRYHKRSFQVRKRIQQDAKYLQTGEFKKYAANPLKFFVDDARDCLGWAKKRFPKAGLYFLGHSQGTYIALQVAKQTPDVRGVALIGFHTTSMDLLIFEQMVYRPLRLFRALDKNHDGVLDEQELKADDKIARQLRAQMKVIDLDGDGKLSDTELKAANYSNLAAFDMAAVFRKQEAEYPRPAEILKAAKFQVAFFQGLLDNQTPAYQAKSIELLTRHVWKKPNFRFHYFPGLGHALDKRTSYDDLEFDTIDPKAKAALAKELKAFFGGKSVKPKAAKPQSKKSTEKQTKLRE